MATSIDLRGINQEWKMYFSTNSLFNIIQEKEYRILFLIFSHLELTNVSHYPVTSSSYHVIYIHEFIIHFSFITFLLIPSFLIMLPGNFHCMVYFGFPYHIPFSIETYQWWSKCYEFDVWLLVTVIISLFWIFSSRFSLLTLPNSTYGFLFVFLIKPVISPYLIVKIASTNNKSL